MEIITWKKNTYKPIILYLSSVALITIVIKYLFG